VLSDNTVVDKAGQ
jgi:hypothetical protein